MRRSIKKALGGFLSLALAAQLFSGLGVNSNKVSAKQLGETATKVVTETVAGNVLQSENDAGTCDEDLYVYSYGAEYSDDTEAAGSKKTLSVRSVWGRREAKNDGAVYDGTTLISVPKDATSITVKAGTTVIGEGAFRDCYNLTKVKLPDSVITIGKNAFYNTKSLKKITLPKNLQEIGAYAFYYSAIQSVELPKKMTEIGDSAFCCAQELKKVKINGKVTVIGASAFRSCSKLSSINIPKSVKTIGESAFAWTKSLKNITLYKGVETIGNYAFEGSGFKSLRIPSSVKEIGTNTFVETSGNVTVAASCKACKMYKGGLYTSDYKTLMAYPIEKTSIKFHPECTGFIWGMFRSSKITKLVLPEKMEELDEWELAGCDYLEEVVIGSKMNRIAWAVFDDCPKLKKITVNKNNNTYSSYNGCIYTKDKKTLIYFPEGLEKVEIHKNTTAFRGNIISGRYYKAEIICPDNMEGLDDLHGRDLIDDYNISFKVKAGTKSAEGLAENNRVFYDDKKIVYTLDNTDAEILAVIKQEKESITVKEKTCVKPDIYLGGLKVSNKFGKTNSICKISWKSSNKKIATVSNDGYITGVKAGKATVTATITLKSGKSKKLTFNITVKAGKFAKGDIISFGSYEQDGDTENGKEPIKWMVLSATNKEAFLITKDVIEYMPIENDSWENSSLRKWLNDEFYNDAFSVSEKKTIKTSNIESTRYYETDDSLKDGYKTKDKIFILSFEEATNPEYGFSKEFKYNYEAASNDYEDINRRSAATDYVYSKTYRYYTGFKTIQNVMTFDSGWCLRNTIENSGLSSARFMYVTSSGSISTYGNYSSYNSGIRPAMKISQ